MQPEVQRAINIESDILMTFVKNNESEFSDVVVHPQELHPLMISSASILTMDGYATALIGAESEQMGKILVATSLVEDSLGAVVVSGFKCNVQIRTMVDGMLCAAESTMVISSLVYNVEIRELLEPYILLKHAHNITHNPLLAFLRDYIQAAKSAPTGVKKIVVPSVEPGVEAFKVMGCHELQCPDDCTANCIAYTGRHGKFQAQRIASFGDLVPPPFGVVPVMSDLIKRETTKPTMSTSKTNNRASREEL
jgi:hypothetical protein